MKRFYLIGFGALLTFDTLAQICFKLAGMHALPLQPNLAWLLRLFAHPWVYGAVIGYLGAFFTWMTLLKHAPIGPAFAASHLEVVTGLLLAVPIFGEHITPVQGLGAIAIVGGILVLAKGEGDAAPD
ncbi:EamA family transporter [Oleiagrimonas citrea]|uniref:EamA family transporter n=1 Tax=Oleiagrimonas citrea TaxID=1665687 RepID=A0A846ZIC2_9GAMM|nr:EamA family transporter [Oleiagrimonas citrea]